MKINLLPQNERYQNRCFICNSFPVKYRANVRMIAFPAEGETVYHQVAICNKCALVHVDMLVEGGEECI